MYISAVYKKIVSWRICLKRHSATFFYQLFICFTKCRHTLMPPSGNKLYIWIFEDFSFSKNCVLSGHVETSTGRSMGIMKCFCHLTSMLLNFWFNFSFDNLFPCTYILEMCQHYPRNFIDSIQSSVFSLNFFYQKKTFNQKISN